MSNFCRFAAIAVFACALGAAPGGLAEANTIPDIQCLTSKALGTGVVMGTDYLAGLAQCKSVAVALNNLIDIPEKLVCLRSWTKDGTNNFLARAGPLPGSAQSGQSGLGLSGCRDVAEAVNSVLDTPKVTCRGGGGGDGYLLSDNCEANAAQLTSILRDAAACSGGGGAYNQTAGLCACPAGFAGPQCQYSNADTCSDAGTAQPDGSCVCTDNVFGDQCQHTRSSLCNNVGYPNSESTCHCDPGFGGSTCELTDDTQCNGNGAVQPDGECECDDKFAGALCELDAEANTIPDDALFKKDGEWTPTKGLKLGTISEMPLEYTIEFDLYMTNTVSNFGSILHLTTGENFGAGGRIPGIWTFPGTQQLHIANEGKSQINPHGVTFNTWHSFKLVVRSSGTWGGTCYAMLDGSEIGNQDCGAKIGPYANVIVYSADPWYEPFGGKLRNLKILAATPVANTIPDIECHSSGRLYTSTSGQCETVATTFNTLEGVSNVKCYLNRGVWLYVSWYECQEVAAVLNGLNGVANVDCLNGLVNHLTITDNCEANVVALTGYLNEISTATETSTTTATETDTSTTTATVTSTTTATETSTTTVTVHTRSSLCNNVGDPNSEGTCDCDPGFGGSTCELTDGTQCNGNGAVQPDGGCICDDTFAGARCTFKCDERATKEDCQGGARGSDCNWRQSREKCETRLAKTCRRPEGEKECTDANPRCTWKSDKQKCKVTEPLVSGQSAGALEQGSMSMDDDDSGSLGSADPNRNAASGGDGDGSDEASGADIARTVFEGVIAICLCGLLLIAYTYSARSAQAATAQPVERRQSDADSEQVYAPTHLLSSQSERLVSEL